MWKKTLPDYIVEMKAHAPEHGRPHWSLSVDWRPGRWDSMSTAPTRGYPILHVRGRDKLGNVIDDMHYACGDGDGMMPPFDGWFIRIGDGFSQVHPVEWQPLTASPEVTDASDRLP